MSASINGQDLVNANQTAQTMIYSGTWDPRVIPTQAIAGTLFMGNGGTVAGKLLSKQDNGKTTNWALIPIKGTPTPPPAFTQNSLYVDPRGSDATGDGSILNPYKTINHAIANTPNASNSNGYVIFVNPGTYDEHIKLPNFVGIVGATPFGAFIQPFTTTGPAFTFDGTNPSNNGILNISINANEDGLHPAILIEAGGVCFLQLCFVTGFGATAAIDNSSFLDSVYGNYSNDGTGDSVTVRGGGTYFAVGDTLNPGSGPGKALNILAGGSVTLYAGVTIFSDSITNAGTLTLQAQSDIVAYTPATLAHWSSVAPTSVANALDRIATKITPIP